MSKGNLFLGRAKGKVGSVVFSVSRGQQITRAYNAQPKNPRTIGQAQQRAIFATAVAAGAGLREVVGNSFDNIKEGQPSINEFVRVNIARMRQGAFDDGANVYYVPKGESYVAVQKWQLSRGSLGVHISSIDDVFHLTTLENTQDGVASGVTLQDIRNVFPQFGNGSQLTFVLLKNRLNDDGTNTLYPVFFRAVFNNSVEQYAASGNAIISGEVPYNGFIPANILDMTKTTATSEYTIPADSGILTGTKGVIYDFLEETSGRLEVTSYDDDNIVGFGMIHTIYDASTGSDPWKHSTSFMDVDLDRYDDTRDNVATYMNQAARVQSSDYYTEQASGGAEDATVYTLEELVSGLVFAQGMKAKQVNLGQSNTYGPVAENSPISFEFEVPSGFMISPNTVKISNGESSLPNTWQIIRSQSGKYLTITGPMPTTTNFPANISFKVWNEVNQTEVGVAAIRVTVSKANA